MDALEQPPDGHGARLHGAVGVELHDDLVEGRPQRRPVELANRRSYRNVDLGRGGTDIDALELTATTEIFEDADDLEPDVVDLQSSAERRPDSEQVPAHGITHHGNLRVALLVETIEEPSLDDPQTRQPVLVPRHAENTRRCTAADRHDLVTGDLDPWHRQLNTRDAVANDTGIAQRDTQ